jgi:hypothetical protein
MRLRVLPSVLTLAACRCRETWSPLRLVRWVDAAEIRTDVLDTWIELCCITRDDDTPIEEHEPLTLQAEWARCWRSTRAPSGA